MRYSRWFLILIRVWPLMKESGSRYFLKLTIFVYLVIIAFTFVPTVLHTIFREKNPLVRVILVGPVSAALASVVKYSLVLRRANGLKFCIDRIESDWMSIAKEEELAIMRRNAMTGRRITIICSLFLYTGGMSYHAIVPLLKGPKINANNATIRPLAYPGYDIFVDPQTSPNYEIIFSLICISAFLRYTVTIAICNLAAFFVCHVCGQIDIVVLRLATIFDGTVHEVIDPRIWCKKMAFIIRCHARGLRLCNKIDETLRAIFLVEISAATTIICLLSYFCMTEWDKSDNVARITYFLLLTSYIFNVFILCHIGELLKSQFQKVGEAAYMMDWYKLPGTSGIAISLIISMSRYSRPITAGQMMEFSINSFGIIMKTALAYLNVLRAVAL